MYLVRNLFSPIITHINNRRKRKRNDDYSDDDVEQGALYTSKKHKYNTLDQNCVQQSDYQYSNVLARPLQYNINVKPTEELPVWASDLISSVLDVFRRKNDITIPYSYLYTCSVFDQEIPIWKHSLRVRATTVNEDEYISEATKNKIPFQPYILGKDDRGLPIRFGYFTTRDQMSSMTDNVAVGKDYRNVPVISDTLSIMKHTEKAKTTLEFLFLYKNKRKLAPYYSCNTTDIIYDQRISDDLAADLEVARIFEPILFTDEYVKTIDVENNNIYYDVIYVNVDIEKSFDCKGLPETLFSSGNFNVSDKHFMQYICNR